MCVYMYDVCMYMYVCVDIYAYICITYVACVRGHTRMHFVVFVFDCRYEGSYGSPEALGFVLTDWVCAPPELAGPVPALDGHRAPSGGSLQVPSRFIATVSCRCSWNVWSLYVFGVAAGMSDTAAARARGCRARACLRRSC